MEHWRDTNKLPPLAGEPGWTPRDEAIVQHALDRLLRHAHPDTGDPNTDDDPFVDRSATIAMRGDHQTRGWWYCDDEVLVLPRRHVAAPAGFVRDDPLRYSVVLTGETRQAVRVIRPRESAAGDAPEDPFVRAEHCATVPLIGAEALNLDVSQDDGRWYYRLRLSEDAVDDALIGRVIDNAERSGARLLAMPEYATSPSVARRWQDALRARSTSSLEWIMLGSGPTDDDPDANVALIMTSDGTIVARQPKTRPYDVLFRDLVDWRADGLPDDPPHGEPVRERVNPHGTWSIIEANTGRFAIAICESVKPSTSDPTVTHLGRAAPTLILCPVLSKPTDQSRWERPATETWARDLVEVVVANSLVMFHWALLTKPHDDRAWVGTAGYRRLDGGSRWQVRHSRSKPLEASLAAVSVVRPRRTEPTSD